MTAPKKKRGPKPKRRPYRLTGVTFESGPPPASPPTAPQIAEVYRRTAEGWPPGVGTNMAVWLRQVAAALEEGDTARTGAKALVAIHDLEEFIFRMAPLVDRGQRQLKGRIKGANKTRGQRWTWGR